jgi:hypothetical protein
MPPTYTLHKSVSIVIDGLDPDHHHVHKDDNADGSFAGTDPNCAGCGNRVGYVNSDVPSTDEEADAATFIPCVEVMDNSYEGLGLYCLTCVLDGTMDEEAPLTDEDDDDDDD